MHERVALAGGGQDVEHPPQWFTSTVSSTSHPFASFPSQSPNPGWQLAIRHVDETQDAVARGSAQAIPHPPQALGSVRMLVSHPSAANPLQFA